MTIELFIILSILGTGLIGIVNLYIAYVSYRILCLTQNILQETTAIRIDTRRILNETITIRKDTVRIKEENILIRKISEEVRDKL
tara:strand:- start:4299 stop:4553 length:255 start_codon:yes stop_codon:yes gene_type:complete